MDWNSFFELTHASPYTHSAIVDVLHCVLFTAPKATKFLAIAIFSVLVFENYASRTGVGQKTKGQKNHAFTVNEGPVRIQYKYLVPIYVLPEMKLHVHWCIVQPPYFQNRIIMFCLPMPTLIHL
jgi:hypothetical protein